MGVNSLATKASGNIIIPDDPNQYKQALNGDLVPRNTSGVVSASAGSLGTSSFKWLDAWLSQNLNADGDGTFLGKLKFGAAVKGLSIEQDGDDVVIKRNSLIVARFNANGLDVTYPSTASTGISPQQFVSGTSFVDIDDCSVSVTTANASQKVLVSLEPNSTSADSGIMVGGALPRGKVRLYRGASVIYHTIIQGISRSDLGGGDAFYFPCSSFQRLDAPGAAGTYTYKLAVANYGAGSPGVGVYYTRIRATVLP
jgi:hypothetical protein